MMGVYIYVSDHDRIRKRQVSDLEVNATFREALKCDPTLMIEETPRFIKKRWFSKKEITFYQIYHETPAHDGTAYQARYQFSGSGEKRIVIAYLHGIMNGANHSKNQIKQ